MTKSIDKQLQAFLTSELCKERSDDKPLKKFVLRSAAPGAKGSDIETFDLDPTVRIELEEIPVYSGTIVARAQEDADGVGPGVHRYTLLSFVRGEAKPTARLVFRLRGDSDTDLDEEGGEDSPTSKGLLSQLMRHNEAMTRTIVMSTSSLMNTMVRRLESSDRMNEKLIHERTETFKTLESAQSQEHDRNMQLMLTSNDESRKDKAFEKLMGLVPLVINKIVGAKVLPDKSDPLMMLLEPLITGLTQDQFTAIQGTLSQEQTLMFVELLQAFQKRKETASKSKEN